MTVKQAAFLTSRVISLWFFYEAFTGLVQIPSALFTLSILAKTNDSVYGNGFSRILATSSASTISHAILQGIVELVLGIIFYRFGPRVARFLMGDGTDASLVDGNGQNS